jgi:hypothetical protein
MVYIKTHNKYLEDEDRGNTSLLTNVSEEGSFEKHQLS